MTARVRDYRDEIDGEDGAAVKDLLLGRRIVVVDEDEATLTLDDGAVLHIYPNHGGCSCGAGDFELKSLAVCDNAITGVKVESDGEPDKWGEMPHEVITLFVLAEGLTDPVAVVEVEGDEGNGYYGRGFAIAVVRP